MAMLIVALVVLAGLAVAGYAIHTHKLLASRKLDLETQRTRIEVARAEQDAAERRRTSAAVAIPARVRHVIERETERWAQDEARARVLEAYYATGDWESEAVRAVVVELAQAAMRQADDVYLGRGPFGGSAGDGWVQ